MKKKKRPGIERPFTFAELCSLVEKEAKIKGISYFDELDYFSPLNDDKQVTTNIFDILCRVHKGSNEGIYAFFYFRLSDGEELNFAVAKTLGGQDCDYISMHNLSGHICLIIEKYIEEHIYAFVWERYSVILLKDEKPYASYSYLHRKKAYEIAEEAKRKEPGAVVLIRDNVAKKLIEYKP